MAQDEIKNFVFRMKGCTLSSKARDVETALLYLQRMWPDSKFELVSEEHSHFVGDHSNAAPKKAKVMSFPKTPAISKPTIELSIEDRLEQALIDNFGGHAA